jgi:peptide/nickel transport system permease protein
MRMLAYILRRILLLAPVLVGLTILVFVIIRLLPGDPARLAAGPNATPSEIEQITHEFGLDKPLPVQYWDYVDGLAHGDWGKSIYTRRSVLTDLEAYLPATLELVLAAMVIAVAFGIPLGLMAAVHRNRWPDAVTSVMSIGAVSMPRFFLGLLFQLAFAMWLGWLPLSGRFPLADDPPPMLTGLLTIDAIASGHWHALVVALRYLCLPAVAMSLSPLATIIRMMRASTIEVLQQDYVLTERALGLPRHLILFKYVLKNAVSATLTIIGLYFGWLLGGTVLVETVFDWPGIGLYATSAVLTQDFMPIIGVTLCTGTMFVVVNLFVDISYALLNPKVRLG